MGGSELGWFPLSRRFTMKRLDEAYQFILRRFQEQEQSRRRSRRRKCGEVARMDDDEVKYLSGDPEDTGGKSLWAIFA